MLAHLAGTVYTVKPSFTVLDVHGVGYKIHCTPRQLDTLKVGDECLFVTHLVVREDALELFGFPSYDELELFQLLIGISGIGPRSALSIIGLDSIGKLVGAIAHGDVSYLTAVSGVGKKSAEKIVLELKDKMAYIDTGDAEPLRHEDADVLEALKAMGYRAEEAREALKTIPGEITEQGSRIREALRVLAR